MTDAPNANRPEPAIRVRYTVLGLVLGGLWLWGGSDPLWEHVVRTSALLLVVPPVASRILRAVARRRGRPRTVSVIRLVTAKSLVIAVAVIVTALVGDRVAHLDVYVAVWMALMLALGGPAIHHRLLIKTPGTTESDRRTR
jgi:hypothetical protein